MLNGQSLTNKRNTEYSDPADYYCTPTEATEALLDFMNIDTEIPIWECACGSGHIRKVLEKRGYCTYGTDIRSTEFCEKQVDFLTVTKNEIPFKVEFGIITNPPFNVSEGFILKAMELGAKMFCYLLKSQYWHAKRRVELFRKYPPAYILALTWRPDFCNGERGKSPTMDTFWCVWKQCEHDTRYRVLEKPNTKLSWGINYDRHDLSGRICPECVEVKE